MIIAIQAARLHIGSKLGLKAQPAVGLTVIASIIDFLGDVAIYHLDY